MADKPHAKRWRDFEEAREFAVAISCPLRPRGKAQSRKHTIASNGVDVLGTDAARICSKRYRLATF
jgi:hypothetical protein